MKRYRICILILLILLLLSGCKSKSLASNTKVLSTNQQNTDTSMKNSVEPQSSEYDLTSLNIKLPANWRLNTNDKVQYKILDDKGKEKGWILSIKYRKDYDFRLNDKPNHSSIINDEYVDIPLATCRLFTLDSDNGTAASGITGTHNVYFAIMTIKDKVIYIFEFSNNDKSPQTKEQFLEILKDIRLK